MKFNGVGLISAACIYHVYTVVHISAWECVHAIFHGVIYNIYTVNSTLAGLTDIIPEGFARWDYILFHPEGLPEGLNSITPRAEGLNYIMRG